MVCWCMFEAVKQAKIYNCWLHPAGEALMYLFVINISNVLFVLRWMHISFVNVTVKTAICFLLDRKCLED